MDVSMDAKPDVVASACYLPFRDAIFTLLYCDPPHIFYLTKGSLEALRRAGISENYLRFQTWGNRRNGSSSSE